MAATVRMNKLKETVQVKNKSHLRQQFIACGMCVVVMKEDKKNYRGKCFQPGRYRHH